MLLTTILIILVIFFFLRLLFSTAIRLFFRRMTRNPQGKQNVAYKKGETTIVSHGQKQSEVPKDLGDYIDYEDIKSPKASPKERM